MDKTEKRLPREAERAAGPKVIQEVNKSQREAEQENFANPTEAEAKRRLGRRATPPG